MFITVVCVIFLIKLRWPKNKGRKLLFCPTETRSQIFQLEARGTRSITANMAATRIGSPVVSLSGVNFEFWSRLGCSGQSANILSCQGQNLLKPRPDWSPLEVTKSLSHAQMVSFRG